MNNLRSQFPILKAQLNGHDLVYLDSAATSQKPQEVIDAMTGFYTYHNASSHSVHSLGGKVTEMVEETRQVVADFIGSGVDEVVFTSGATEGINLVANGFLEVSLRGKNIIAATTVSPLSEAENTPSGVACHPFGPKLSQGDPACTSLSRGEFDLRSPSNIDQLFCLTKDSEILICVDQHHSNILPWQRLSELIGCKVVFFGVLADGRWDTKDCESKLNINTKVIAISNVSNVLGVVQDVEEMNRILDGKFNKRVEFTNLENTPSGFACHPARGEFDYHDLNKSRYNRPIVVLDATQAVSHFGVDVKELDVDFIVFSGHKIYGPTGVGVLYGKRELLEILPNYKVGGDMVESVDLEKNIYKQSPFRFEAGTANFGSIIGLKAALNWFIRSQKELFKVENELFDYLIAKLKEVEGLKILGGFEIKDCPSLLRSQPLVPRIPQGNLALTGLLDRGNCSSTRSHSGTGSFAPLKMTSIALDSSKIPIVSFNMEGVNSLDLALMLDQKGICVRSGQHCAGILHEHLGINSSCRISLACFNTFEEIDFVIKCIKDAIKILK